MVHNQKVIVNGSKLHRKKFTTDGIVHKRKLRETQIFHSRGRVRQVINPQSNSIEFEKKKTFNLKRGDPYFLSHKKEVVSLHNT